MYWLEDSGNSLKRTFASSGLITNLDYICRYLHTAKLFDKLCFPHAEGLLLHQVNCLYTLHLMPTIQCSDCSEAVIFPLRVNRNTFLGLLLCLTSVGKWADKKHPSFQMMYCTYTTFRVACWGIQILFSLMKIKHVQWCLARQLPRMTVFSLDTDFLRSL